MKATKKILGAAAALVLSLGIATGSTYAWFASNSTATVDSFDVSVTSSTENLLVAIGSNPKDSDFKSRITNADIVAAIEATNSSPALDALTTKDNGITFYSKTEAAKTSGGTATKASSGKYVTFTLTFRSYTELRLMLDTDSAVTEASENKSTNMVVAWADSKGSSAVTKELYGADIDLNSKISARAADAARVSFVPTTVTEAEDDDTEDTITYGTSKVWSPNEHNVDGSQVNYTTEESNVESSDRGCGFWKGNLASDYNTYMSGEKAVTQQAYTSTVTPLVTSTEYDEGSEIVALTKVETDDDDDTTSNSLDIYQATITVNIWLEGTDGDCLDSIFNDKFSVALNFVALAYKVPTTTEVVQDTQD